MRDSARISLPARERGAALLILLALIIPVLIYAVVAGLNRSAGELAQAREQKTYAALAQAKEALIAYAVTYKETHDDPGNNKYYVPGYLPCPDLGSSTYEGQTALNCPQSGPTSLVSVMGRLPWRTLGLEALKDGSGECLWYAVSGTYKNDPNGNAVSGSTITSNMMNWDTNGQFAVKDADGVSFLTGSTADTNAVAVIFAPGAVLSGQDRTPPVAGTTACGGNYTSAAYLETANGINNSVVSGAASAQSTFITGASSSTFNDKLVYITRTDIWNAIKKRADFNNYLRAMTRRAAECTARYGANNSFGASDQRLPWASNPSLSTTSVPTYAVNASYNDANSGDSGRLSFRVETARSATGNSLVSNSDYGTSSRYIFTLNSYCSYSPDQKVWYDNWKDQLFYAIANAYRPSAGKPTSCGTCLTINGIGSYAAVVIFAGDKLTNAAGQVTQPRSLATDKGLIANYLEGRNSSNHPNNSGNGNYQAAAASSTFNDIVYAIDSSLTVKCLSAGSGTMTTVSGVAVAPPGDPANYAACP